MREWLGGACLRAGCHETGRLELAHVAPTGVSCRGRGAKERERDVRQNPECYSLLCPRCHRAVDLQLPIVREWKIPTVRDVLSARGSPSVVGGRADGRGGLRRAIRMGA